MSENKVQIVVEVDAKTGRATIRQLGEEMETAGKKGASGFDQAGAGVDRVRQAISKANPISQQLGVEMDTAGKKGARGFGEASAGADRLGDGVDRLKRNLSPVVGLATQLGMAWGTAEIIQTADAMRAMDARLLLTARNTADYVEAQQDVVSISHQAHQELSGVTTLYNRLALSTANLNVAQTDLADVTKTVALSVALSGSASQESAAGMLQFAQAMGSGRLQGDELRSVMENMPQLAKILVDAAGGSMAQFREMAKNGELTTEWMVNAIKKALPEMEAMAAGMPITIGMAVNDFKTSASQYIATVDAATGSSAGLAVGIGWLGQNLETVAEGGVLILTGGLSLMATRGIASVMVAMPGMIAAVREYATVTETATVMTTAYSMATETTSRVSLAAAASKLLTMPNIIGAVTTALSVGAVAWAMWGDGSDDAAKRAEAKLAQLRRYNQQLKELADPELALRDAASNRDAARARMAAARHVNALGDIIVSGPEYAEAEKAWKQADEEYRLIQENMALSTKIRAGKQMAAEQSVTDFEREQNAERAKATEDALGKKLLDIEEERQAELKATRDRFKNADDLARAEQAVNSRFDAEKATATLKAHQIETKKAAGHAKQLAEEWVRVKLELTDEAGAVALIGLDHELAEIEKKADRLRHKFGNRPEIDAWQAEAENAKIQADYRERQKKQIEAVGKAQKEWDKAALAGLSEQDQAIAKVRAEFDGYRQDLVESAATLNKPMEEVYATLDNLDRAEAEAVRKAKDKTDDLTQFQIQAFRNMQDAGAGFFESLRTGSDDWLANFEQMTLKMVDQWASAQAMMGLFGKDFAKGGDVGGLAGSLAGSWNDSSSTLGGLHMTLAGIFHDGGIVGGHAPTRAVSPELFAGAPRYHKGLAPDEFPAILQRGEAVIPRNQVRQAGQQQSQAPGGDQYNITIIAADAQSITDMMRRNPQAVLGPFREALQKGDRGLRADLQRVIS